MTGIDKALGFHHRYWRCGRSTQSAGAPNHERWYAGYKARDIDFASALEQATASQGAVERTHSAHIALSGSAAQPDVMYRVPAEVAPDGNSVDPTLEHSAFMENALRYQASLQLLTAALKA